MDFTTWNAQLSTIMYEDRIILSPRGFNTMGFLQSQWTFAATHWEMSIDWSIDHDTPESANANDDVSFFFL